MKKWKGLRIAVIVVCVVIVLVGFGYGEVYRLLGRMNRVNPEDFEYIDRENETFESDPEDAGYDRRDADEVVWNEVEKLDGKDVINLLLIGQDRRENEGRARSDSMILLSINRQAKRIAMVSFMRDLYVQIPGYSDNRINASYVWGGMELLDQTIEQNFGIEIDGNIEVDFSQFETIIDILGGVEVEMTKKEAQYMQYTMESGKMVEGVNRLNGKQALDYARMRYLDDDFHRTERQRHLLMQLAGSLRSASSSQLLELVETALSYVTTDMTNAQVIGYVSTAVQVYLSDSEILTGRIPPAGGYSSARIREMDVLVPDLAFCQDYLEDIIYGETTDED